MDSNGVASPHDLTLVQKLLQGEHIPEWVTGLSTLMLFISTVLLVFATYFLAKITREDGLHRRREATMTAWMKIRADMDVPDLREQEREIVLQKGVEFRPLLREIEAFSALMNAKVYDIDTFNRISGGWFVRNFEKIFPYVEIRHREMSHKPYNEMITLNQDLVKLREKESAVRSQVGH